VSAVFIISIFLLVLASLAILRSQRSRSQDKTSAYLAPMPPRGLFDHTGEAAPTEQTTREEAQRASSARAAYLRERASQGDFESLLEAHTTGDNELYREVLDALAQEGARTPALINELASMIANGGELRATPAFAEKMLAAWRESPDREPTTMLLRIAALSGDAETYRKTIEAVSENWNRNERMSVSAADLLAFIESEYWLLSPEARSSGAGFVLKRTLIELRRALSAGAQRESRPSTEAN
jgi:hypothetical protein